MLQVNPDSPSALYNTLLDLYLRACSRETEQISKSKASEKVMTFLEEAASRYDMDQALVLCQIHAFSPGTLFIYEQAKL